LCLIAEKVPNAMGTLKNVLRTIQDGKGVSGAEEFFGDYAKFLTISLTVFTARC